MNKLSISTGENDIYEEKEEPIIKYSLMRMMSRSWGNNVMKSLFENFQAKIKSLLEEYQSILLQFADCFNQEISKKGFEARVSSKYKLESLTRDILRQALLNILDVSVNEINIKMVNNSCLILETFYPQIEEMLINHTKKFLKKLNENYSVTIFVFVSQLY